MFYFSYFPTINKTCILAYNKTVNLYSGKEKIAFYLVSTHIISIFLLKYVEIHSK